MQVTQNVKGGKGKTIHVGDELWRRLMKLKYDLGARNVEDVIELALRLSGLESGATKVPVGKTIEAQKGKR